MKGVVIGSRRGAQLQLIPLFSGLSESALERLGEIAAEVEFPAGFTLIERDQPGSGMYLVEEGRVAVELPSRMLELGPGEFFGELSLLVPSGHRVARVRAVTRVRCLAVSRVDFALLLKEEPEVAVAMLPVLAQRLVDETQAKS
jgi:CRP-like cAMP-binding protein